MNMVAIEQGKPENRKESVDTVYDEPLYRYEDSGLIIPVGGEAFFSCKKNWHLSDFSLTLI